MADQNPNDLPDDDDLGLGDLDGLDLDGDDLGGEELSEPGEPTEADASAIDDEADASLEPDSEALHRTMQSGPQSGSRGRNPERRKNDLSLFQQFMTSPLADLRNFSQCLQSESDRLKEIKAEREREERRLARLGMKAQVESFLEDTNDASGYQAPVSDLTEPESLNALKNFLATIPGFPTDRLIKAPATAEEKNVAFTSMSRGADNWVANSTISQWLRSCRGLAGLLPEWHEIERHDIMAGRPVFQRIGIVPIPADYQLPSNLEGFHAREIGPGMFPIGWHMKLGLKGAKFLVGEEFSVVVLDNSAMIGTVALNNDEIPSNSFGRFGIAIRGGMKALRKQIFLENPMAGRERTEALAMQMIDQLSVDPEKTRLIFQNAVGARGWDHQEAEAANNVVTDTTAFNSPVQADGQAVLTARQIANTPVRNMEGETRYHSQTHISRAVGALTEIHQSSGKATRNNILAGASPIKSRMDTSENGSTLSMSCDMTDSIVRITFPIGRNGQPESLSGITIDSETYPPIHLTPMEQQPGRQTKTVSGLIQFGLAVFEDVKKLHSYFEDGIGSHGHVLSVAENLKSLTLNPGVEISGVPYSQEDLSETITAMQDKIRAAHELRAREDSINEPNNPTPILDTPPAAAPTPGPGM